MFNIYFNRRKLIILSLVFVLISISFLNYMINKHSLLETSSEFENYEEKQLAIIENEDNINDVIIHENIGEGDENSTSSIAMIMDESNVVDSKNNDVDDIMAVSNLNIKNSVIDKDSNSTNYFLQAKIDIEIEREKTLERFDEIINNKMIDEESRKNAVNKKMKLIELMNKEKIIESLIKGKGFEDAIVFFTDESVYVTVSDNELTKSDIAKILDIVTRETKIGIDNIKIQQK